MQFILREQF